MRTLEPAPPSVLDASTGAPRIGAYRGPLPRVDLSSLARGKLWRLFHEKRWMYVAISADPLLVGVAIADLGYLCNGFAFVFDRAEARMIADRTALAPPFAGDVNDTSGPGHLARFELGATRLRFERAAAADPYRLEVRMGDLEISAELFAGEAPPPISVVAPIPGGVLNTTEKRALLHARGSVRVGDTRHAFERGLGGYDYTHGLLARRTSWRWAFAQGHAKDGEPIAFNLVEGFVGEPECALWANGELHPLAEGRFTFDPENWRAPWKLRTADGALDLDFVPGGAHAEKKNFGVVASRFLQPMGVFRGTIAVPGRETIEIDDVLGVTEDQEILW